MTEMPAKISRDVSWVTHSCSLGYDLVGKTCLSRLLEIMIYDYHTVSQKLL